MAKKEESPAAALARLRWKDTTEEDRAAHSEMMNDAKMERTTAEQRSASAKKAAAARWAGKKKAVKKGTKNADK